jgi:hypothetical protein
MNKVSSLMRLGERRSPPTIASKDSDHRLLGSRADGGEGEVPENADGKSKVAFPKLCLAARTQFPLYTS